MSNDFILTSDGELYHYGVLGMKWGVRRGRSAKAYEKASRKLNRLDKRANKAVEKAYKKREKADRRSLSLFRSDRSKAKTLYKAKKAATKASVKTAKAKKWLKEMEKTFQDTPESLSKEQINMGKRYADIMNNRVFS